MSLFQRRISSAFYTLVFVASASFTSSLQAECLTPDAAAKGKPTSAALRKMFPTLAAGTYEIVFFATWCPACKLSLEAKKNDNAILVGTMDELDDINRAYDLLGKKRPCVYDEDGLWLKALGSSELPYSARLDITAAH